MSRPEVKDLETPQSSVGLRRCGSEKVLTRMANKCCALHIERDLSCFWAGVLAKVLLLSWSWQTGGSKSGRSHDHTSHQSHLACI